MCDHVIAMSLLAEMRELVTQSEKTRYITDARTELLDDAACRQDEIEEINVLSDDAILNASTEGFSYCPRCGAKLQKS
jgi:hypothetical protein